MRAKAAFVAAAIVFGAAASNAGTYFSAVTTSDGAKDTWAPNATVRCWAEGPKARVEFAESDSTVLKPGLFLMTLDGGSTTYLVDLNARTFSRWDLGAVLRAETAATAGHEGSSNRTYSEPKVAKLSEDDGGQVAGVATLHLKVRTTFTSEIMVKGARRSSSTVVDEDVWVAPGLNDAGLGLWLAKAPIRTGDETFDSLLAARAPYSGYPLKRTAVATTTEKGGAKSVATTTLTVTELIAGAMPARTFTMASGLREAPLPLPAPAGAPDEKAPAADQTMQPTQDEDRYPFENMLDQPGSEPASGQPAPQPQGGGQPAVQPGARPGGQPGTQPNQPEPTPEPEEQPPYAFERMLDAPER
jgi:hypothetical protein